MFQDITVTSGGKKDRMAKFRYSARNPAGTPVKGAIEAANQQEAMAQLKKDGLNAIELSTGLQIELFAPPKKCNTAELAMFTRQLATMLGAGIALLEALDVLAEQTMDTNKGFARGLRDLSEQVRGGRGLSEAMQDYRRMFPAIYINMIRAGEASGQLDAILTRLAEYMESSESLKAEIKSAMTYPVISLLLVFGITAYLLVGVVPKFQKMFTKMKVKMPPVTTFVLTLSEGAQKYWYMILAGVIGFIVFYVVGYKNPAIARIFDTVKLKMPVFGALIQKVIVARFAQTFSTLLNSGVPLLGALEIVATTSGSKVIEDAVLGTRDSVKSGEPLSKHLGTCWVFPPMVVRMTSIGERTGKLELLLSKIAEFYEEQVHTTVKSLTSLIEPIMIAIMGAVVGTIVLAIFWPILEMQSAMTKK